MSPVRKKDRSEHANGGRYRRDDYGPLPHCLVASLRRAILSFYRKQRRDLPWRRTRDPYAIWVSEIMLQQTQVKTVEERYAVFLRRFPDVQRLAAAGEARVCEAWAGLGYYRRARHMVAAARKVLAEHGGLMPRDVKQLCALPGIGRYTAGAIASIAFDEPAPVVDGNVARVLARLRRLEHEITTGEGQKILWLWASQLVDGAHPGNLNQGLMELGATVCTPKQPSCSRCPLAKWCEALASGKVSRYPRKAKRAERRELVMAMAHLHDERGLWLRRRPLDGLWAGLWEMPSAVGPAAALDLARELGVELEGPVAEIEHQLTHRDVTLRVYKGRPSRSWKPSEGFLPFDDPFGVGLSALAVKALKALSGC